ncbi:MAG: GNAT family N-acetyltransferase [Bacteriovoracaceae bacterium]
MENLSLKLEKCLKSLALTTDLIFIKQNGEVLERENYLVVKHANPNFFWGNLLIFKKAPVAGDLDTWVGIFKKEFTHPDISHQTFTWDEEVIGEIDQFDKAGFKLEKNIILTANRNQIKLPFKNNSEVEIVPLKTKSDWSSVIEMQSATSPQYKNFYEKQAIFYQKMVDQKLGLWFGAYLNGEIVASLGLFTEGSTGRFQIVCTHPDYQRRGICGTLVYEVSKYAFENMGIEILVMVADEEYHAAKVYESVGFVPKEKTYGVCHWEKSKCSI